MSRLVLILAAALLQSCITPSVVASSGRAVESAEERVAWSPAEAEDIHGLFESTAIEGDAALALWRVYYHFADDGTYSGAALVLGGSQPEFQTLSGRWTLRGELIDLGDGQTAIASAAPERLRLASEGGVVILRRVTVN